MYEFFTESSRELVKQAERLAKEMGQAEISSGHILLAILTSKDRPNLGRLMLERFRVTPEAARKRIAGTLGRVNPHPYARLRLSAEARRMIIAAGKERVLAGSPQIHGHHLILGALADGNCLAAQLLKEMNVGLDEARQQAAKTSYRLAQRADLAGTSR